MARRRTNRLLTLNDSRLAAFLLAQSEEDRDAQLERILRELVMPVAERTVAAFTQGNLPVGADDRDDVISQLSLRIIRKFRAALVLEEESVQELEPYVTTLTRNILCDVMRGRSPGRMRARSRLRYLLAREARVAAWTRHGVMVVGLVAHNGAEPLLPDAATTKAAIERVPIEPESAADAVVAVLTALGPLRFSTLVSIFAEVWGESDSETADSVDPAPVPEAILQPGEGLEWRQYLEIVWRELCDLPSRQRMALLLNLRAPESENAAALFLITGVARFEEIAAAVGMLPHRLGEIWDELPLSDIAIASLLGGSRQQVINLRKSARKRLMRRMSGHAWPG